MNFNTDLETIFFCGETVHEIFKNTAVCIHMSVHV